MIQNSTLTFLEELEANNNREWFKKNKIDFNKNQEIIKMLFQNIANKMRSHDHIETVKIFRIYRDIRFSKDKTPYKTHFSGGFKRLKPTLRGGYYLHIAPKNNSFIAAGFWNPNKDDLLRIRKEIAVDKQALLDITKAKDFKETWGELEGEALKTAPRGFDRDHPNIDWIRQKQFFFTKKYTNKEVCSPDFAASVSEDYRKIRPFFNYMSEVLTTNLNGESIL